MTPIFRLITIALLKAARWTSTDESTKHYISVALVYEEDAA